MRAPQSEPPPVITQIVSTTWYVLMGVSVGSGMIQAYLDNLGYAAMYAGSAAFCYWRASTAGSE